MSDLTVRTEVDLHSLDNMLKAAGERAPVAISRALNRAGVPVANAMKRQIRKVLGLRGHPYAKKPPGHFLRRRTSVKKSTPATLVFSLAGFGAGLPAIYYQPKEAPPGASINWLGARKTLPRSFYLGGKFPRRKRSKISHAVWRRIGAGKWGLDRPDGPGIPDAMRTPSAIAVWEGQAAARLPHHLRSALESLLAGHFKVR